MYFGVSICMWYVHLFKFQVRRMSIVTLENVCILQFITLVIQIRIPELYMQHLQVFNLLTE